MKVNNGVKSTEVSPGTGDTQIKAASNGLRLMGFSVKETAAAVATLALRHGTSSSDPVLAFCNLIASDEKTYWFPDGIQAPNGIFLDRLTGTTAIVVYTAP